MVGDVVINVARKRMKNMYIRVRSDGSVQISAPNRLSKTALQDFAHSHYDWIKKQQAVFAARPVVPERQYLSGEIHYLWGQPYHLEVASSAQSSVQVLNDKIILQVHGPTSKEQREALLDKWYRQQLAMAIPPVLARCQDIVGVSANEWRIKKMKTRWGTCNVLRKRIWINLQLAKKTPDCLDYIVIHELTHLLEKSHNAVFKGYMDQFYPGWREVRKSLNRQAN